MQPGIRCIYGGSRTGKTVEWYDSLESLPHQIDGVGELQIYRDENGWLIGYDKDCVKVAACARTLKEALEKIQKHKHFTTYEECN